MNLRLGIYEVFSRIVPGGLYIVAVAQFLLILGIVDLDPEIVNNLSLAASIGLVVVAYILGGAFDVFSLAFFRLFKKPGFSNQILAEFKTDHAHRWRIDFNDGDLPILFAYIRTKNLELAGELDRHNAVSIMLRNVSLGLLLMAVNGLIQFLIYRNPISVFISSSMLALSLLMIRESIKFRGFFYKGVYETILAYRVDLETAIRPIRPAVRRSKTEKIDE
jgi:hypothetical protein